MKSAGGRGKPLMRNDYEMDSKYVVDMPVCFDGLMGGLKIKELLQL